MKAYICTGYGGPGVLHLTDIPKPVPKDDEILVKIYATSVTSGDVRVRSMNVPPGLGLIARLALGITAPRQPILGTEMAGIVEAVGRKVTRFAIGDKVFAFPGGSMGCYAEYRCIAENGFVAHKPVSLSFSEAVGLCFGGSTALHFLRKVNAQAGDSMLVIGASGGVGAALVQLAARQGVTVTAVTSRSNLDLVRSLGALIAIDYTAEDVTRFKARYDIIMDVVGATSFNACKHLLANNGRYAPIAGGLADMLSVLWAPLYGKKVIAGPAEERVDDILQIAELANNGGLKPVVDRVYAFEQMVAAHAFVDTDRKKGTVVITVANG